jgi:predicted nuclease with TOPRIM domain
MSEQTSGTKNWLYFAIIGILAASTGYLYFSKNQQEDKTHLVTEQLADVSSAKQALQDEYNATLQRLDEMKTQNSSMDSLLASRNAEIKSLLDEISSIKNKTNASAEELASARRLITALQGKLDGYQKQIDELKQANAQLATEKQQVTQQRDQLESEKSAEQQKNEMLSAEKQNLESKNSELSNTVSLAKVLHAGNIRIEPIKKQWLTGKEVDTEKAKRAKLMRISFDLDDNRVAESGNKDIYIVVYGPDGNAYKKGSFNLVDGTQKAYSAVKTIAYTQGKTSKGIDLEWKPEGKFDAGDYNVEIYHSGYKIGEQVVKLK